ncbi:MAG: type 2 lantipeptide synthetase LanM family protein [Calothrix sp. FI2-JRJ7]|jgi:type 2 lantibiotic biosynthesis protein LanM|nr:type 2 lantipeptide synthetase LanM family protein [Calothrix sp. FI2-JRJ7]
MLTSNKFALTQLDLANIVVNASYLSERIDNELFKINAIPPNKETLSLERLEHWCRVVAGGNWEKFQKRLQWAEWNIDTVRLSINSVCLKDSQTLPDWAITLSEVIQTAESFLDEFKIDAKGELKSQIPIDPENPLPFEDLLLPACFVARHKLLNCLGSGSLSPSCLPLELLDEKAYLAMERNLLSTLVHICEKSLEYEFSRSRPFGQSLLNVLLKDTKLNKNKTYYQAFVQKLLQDGMLTFFQKYPVLGRLLATQINFWVEATTEFLQRLKADLPNIQQTLANCESTVNTKLGKVIEIKLNLSDPHKGGRCVIALTFESGLKLVYKPRNLGLEFAYNQFLNWCNEQGVLLPFKVIKVINCQTYGWMEYVEQLPCSDEVAAQHFYQRAGMLLCLLYTLGAADCHYENLIACGEHLVLVDMEALMHHEQKHLEDFPQATAMMAVNEQFWKDSVLRTGLLPRWDINQDKGIAYDISGLGSVDRQPSPWRVLQWESVNTDNMHQVYQTKTMPVGKNVPVLNGVSLSPNNYLEDLVEGFGQMYRFLLKQRQFLLAKSSPLTALSNQQVRFIFRPTKVYATVLQKTLAPEFLRNGIDRSIELDILARAFVVTENKPNAWPILASELRAMEQLDIPYFGANSGSNALSIGVEQPIEQYFVAPSYTQVILRLQKFDQTNFARQVAIIRETFYARVARESLGTKQISADSTFVAADSSTYNILTNEQLLTSACNIASEIEAHAIREADGSVYWMGLNYIPNVERFQFQLLDESLYNGNCGIALFIAALADLKSCSSFHDLAFGALQPTRRILQIADAELARRCAKKIGIGGATGLGSIIYSLVKISHFLKEPALIEDAQRFTNFITLDLIAQDQQFDVMNGTAGLILGLLALYNQTLEKEVLDKAIACAQHLLEHQISVDGLPRAWKTKEGKPLTGFSHGTAGIAYALLQLYSFTHDSIYKEAASEGIAYERSCFSSAAANWPDFRSFAQQNGQPGFSVSWCHGAPGIGLARLGALSILDTEEIRQDVEVALQTTQKYGLQGVDHLCCGNLGRCELLLVGAQKLSRPALLTMAQQKAAWVVARAERTRAYQLFANLPNYVFSPCFFQGTAGIGYELLRLAYPEVLPSILLWE